MAILRENRATPLLAYARSMTSRRRLALVLGAAGLVAFRLFACGPILARLSPPALDAGRDAAPIDASPIDAAPTSPSLVLPRYDSATLLGNGHVLMPTKDIVYDWDPFGPTQLRKASLGDAGPAHTSSFVPLGGHQFVVAKADEADNVLFELWDAERLVPFAPLGGYVTETPFVDFSRDGKRLLIAACAKKQCDVGVNDLETGRLVHRTRIRIPNDDPVQIRISPTGAYFGVSATDVATTAYDAETGRVVYKTKGGREAMIEDEIFDFGFVDDRHFLTANTSDGVSITDLATGKTITHALPWTTPDMNLRVLTGPSHDWIATELSNNSGRFSVLLLAVDGAAHALDVPSPPCPQTCAMRWSGEHEVMLATNILPPPAEFRIDVAAGAGTIEPYHEPQPFEVFGVQPVHGDFDRFGTTKWHPENRTSAFPAGALVTPRGVQIDLRSVDMEALLSASGDRFLFDGMHALQVITSDGKRAALTTRTP